MLNSRQFRKAMKCYDFSSYFYNNVENYAKDEKEARDLRRQAKRWRNKARRRIDKMYEEFYI